eukprot:XP_010661265.1 PREDICTED: vegetative cell wall protein gp1-like [Vitis vinifera]
MAKTRGGLSASPSSPIPRPQQSTIGGATSPPVQDSAVPPSEGGTPSQRRYPTRRPPTNPVTPADQSKRPVSRPPTKRTKFSAYFAPQGALAVPPPQGAPAEPAPHGPPVMPPPPELPQDEQLPQAQQDEILTDTTPPALAAHTSDQIIATQTQHTKILHQIQQHLSMQTPLQHDRSGPSEPLVPDQETIPAEQPISAEEIRAKPSHDPTTS